MSATTPRRLLVVATAALAASTLAAPALAAHDHYVLTPNGACHLVAAGQTAIADETHGGYHQFHDHVHIAATDDDLLGHGHARVAVYKAGPAPAVCDGD